MRMTFKGFAGKRYNIDVVSSYISIVATMLVGFFILFGLTKYAGVEVYGKYVILKSTLGVMSGVLAFRSGEAVTRFCKEAIVEHKFSEAKSAIIYGLFFDVVVSFLIFVVLFFFSGVISRKLLQDNSISFLVFVYGFATIATYLRNVPIGYFLSVDKVYLVNIFRLFESFAIIFGLLVFIVNDKMDLERFVVLNVAVSCSITLIFFVKFIHLYLTFFRGVSSGFSRHHFNRYLKFSFKTFLSGTLKSTNQNIDNVVLAYFLSPFEVGGYQAMKKILSLIEVVAQPWKMISYGPLVKKFVERKYAHIKNYIFETTTQLTLLSLVFAILLLLLMEPLSKLIGVNISEKHFPFSMLIALTYVLATVYWWGRIFSNVFNPNISLGVNGFILFYHVTIGAIMVAKFSLVGAVVSFFILNLILVLAWLYIFRCTLNVAKEYEL